MKCRHSGSSWLIAGGMWEWCYRCGAIRSMQKVRDSMYGVMPGSAWAAPTGAGGENPHERWVAANAVRARRIAKRISL